MLTVERLRVNYLTDPVGIDDPTPMLSWLLTSPDRGQRQGAYQVLVSSAGAVVWDSGEVQSTASAGIPYQGPPLRSRQRLSWTVRVWDGQGQLSAWSAPATWEMGLLARSDWYANWVMDPATVRRQDPLVIQFAARQTRYVRLNVTRLGKPLQEGWPDPVSRLQLAELQVLSGGTLLSQGDPTSASEAFTVPGVWGPEFLTDGTLNSDQDPRGYTSFERHAQETGTSPIWVQVDLGSVVTVDEVRLYPRTDVVTPDRQIANFPENFTIQVSTSASGPWTIAHRAIAQAAPPVWALAGLPLMAKVFTVEAPVESARLYAVGLGICEFRLNGNKVGDAVLEPAFSDYRKRVPYTTYDVTNLLRDGTNTLGAMLGHGVYDIVGDTGRYTKFTGSMGPMKLLVQLEITHTDGTSSGLVTDGSWRVASGPTTFTNWFGGEDYDARREIPGWDAPDADHSQWRAVSDLGAPAEILSAQEAPPVRVQETVAAVSRNQVATGVWLYDLGRNLAGWPELTLRGAAGQTARLVPGEKLTAGRVNQIDVGAPVYFQFTQSTGDAETWHPTFMYYGFRYIEISGTSTPPELADVRALVLRADNTPTGRIETSDATLNATYGMVVRAIESNMFSVLTDCPHREKLGWLEEIHLLYDTIAANFDVAAYYRKLARDIRDAQLPNGMVPDIAPEFTVFADGFRDDPNWGGALIMVPYKHYQVYGDDAPMRAGYQAMRRYMDYLASRATDHVLSYGLGDWGAFDTSTPLTIPATSAYYRYATVMAEIADVVGQGADAAGYRTLAQNIHNAVNARLFLPTIGGYGSGSQASNALPLAAGLVPGDRRAPVLTGLKADIAQRGNHLSTGEIGLRGLFDALGETGDVDIVLGMARNPTAPSYAAMLASGATTLPEFWDGTGSQNHFMMGAINDWSYRYLAGIRPTAPGFRRFLVAPVIPQVLTSVTATLETLYGRIDSGWTKSEHRLRMRVTVPVNTEAEVRVPTGGVPSRILVNGERADSPNLTLGSGDYEIRSDPR